MPSCPLFLIACYKQLLFLTPRTPSSVIIAKPSAGKPHSTWFCGRANHSTYTTTWSPIPPMGPYVDQ